MFIETYIK